MARLPAPAPEPRWHAILEAMRAKGQLAGFAEREKLRDDVTRRLGALTHAPP